MGSRPLAQPQRGGSSHGDDSCRAHELKAQAKSAVLSHCPSHAPRRKVMALREPDKSHGPRRHFGGLGMNK